MKNEEMAEDICGRLCKSKDNNEYNAMYLACMEAMEWKDAQAVQDRDIIRKHWQRWAEEREEKMKNNIEKRIFSVFYHQGVLLVESEIHEIVLDLTKAIAKDLFVGRKKMYNDLNTTLEHLFPELKEHDDERTKKSTY